MKHLPKIQIFSLILIRFLKRGLTSLILALNLGFVTKARNYTFFNKHSDFIVHIYQKNLVLDIHNHIQASKGET
ncbi:hypothetical protein L2E82_51635 [Cichorium intybus]|nr:hypothetical protein L2E82_51635 [Cichorium intybus]